MRTECCVTVSANNDAFVLHFQNRNLNVSTFSGKHHFMYNRNSIRKVKSTKYVLYEIYVFVLTLK